MTLRRILCTSVLVWVPALAAAQVATLKSGEHEDFTRVVVPVPRSTDWDVSQRERTVTISVPEFAGSFDASAFFDLVPRDRVVDVSTDGNEVSLTLGCDCKVAPFLTGGRFLVVDVAAQGVILEAAAIAPVEPPQAAIETAVVNEAPPQAALLDVAQPEPAPVATPESTPSGPAVLPLIIERSGTSFSPQLTPADLPNRARAPLSDADRAALNEMQKRLSRELSVAATRGILNPVPARRPPEVITLDTFKPDSEEEPNEQPAVTADATRGSLNNLRVTSSSDLPFLVRNSDAPLTLTGETCPTNQDVAVASWVDDRPFYQQMGEVRQALYGEFDVLDKTAALKLAKIYIHFGFGAEALQILALDPAIAGSKTYLADIAHILEDGSAPDDSSLRDLLDCETDISLWAILAKPELSVARTIDGRAALRALDKLPVHLREILAPALSQRFLSHGDTSSAATAMRNLERLPGETSTAAKLAQANLAIDTGDVDAGTEKLADVIDDNALQSPEALITLVETQLSENQPIDPETAGLIEAYAKELNGSEIGPALRRAHVLALVKSGQFDSAFNAITELGGDSEEDAAVALRLQVAKEVIAAASDVVFLEHFFAMPETDTDRLAARSKTDLATRLLELGFPRDASTVLAGMPDRPVSAVRQILLARAALDLEQPQDALDALMESNSEEAELLRARAQLMVGSHGEAYASFQKANRPDDAVTAAWLSEAIAAETLGDDPLFGPVLALAEAPADVSAAPEGMLERSASALTESEEARKTLEALLATPRLEVEGEAPTDGSQ